MDKFLKKLVIVHCFDYFCCMIKKIIILITVSLISLLGYSQQQAISSTFDANAKERLKQDVYTLASDSLQGRKAGTKYAKMAADYITQQFTEIGIEPYFGDSYLHVFKRNDKYRNIVGVIRGNDPVLKDEYIVVGAHYDHLGKGLGGIYHGADDNASGVAAMMELGRVLKREQPNLKRSIILIAFDAEENGLVGSSHFVFRLKEAPIENIKLMICFDMVGYYKASNQMQLLGAGTIKNANEMLLNPQIVPTGLNIVIKDFERSPFYGTDTQPFALKRIPTLWAFTGLKSPFHTPKDDAHLIDYDGMVMITEYMTNLVEAISCDTDFESSGKLSKKHKPRQRVDYGVFVNFGSSMHHYTAGKDYEDDSKTALSFGAGLTSQVNFGCFAIRPELQYDNLRALNPSGTITTNSLTLPVSLVLQTPEYFFFGWDVFFGGYYSYRLGGKQGREKIDFENAFNRGEGGLNFGIGFYYKPVIIGVTARMALTNFTQSVDVNNAYLRNRTMYLTMRYMF